jgi:hypothetical protein
MLRANGSKPFQVAFCHAVLAAACSECSQAPRRITTYVAFRLVPCAEARPTASDLLPKGSDRGAIQAFSQ